MHSSKELELHREAGKVTWCGCEACCAVGPRFMTLVRNHHEYTVALSPHCCEAHIDDEELSGAAPVSDWRA